MAKIPNGIETLPKISIVWVGRTNVTDRRQTDGRRHIANVSSRSLIKLNLNLNWIWITCEVHMHSWTRVICPIILPYIITTFWHRGSRQIHVTYKNEVHICSYWSVLLRRCDVKLCFGSVLQNTDDAWFLIDSERFEQMDIKCRLLPAKLHFFASDSFSVPLDDIAVGHTQWKRVTVYSV